MATRGSIVLDKFVVLIKGGPCYELEDGMTFHAEVVSRYADGVLWTFGPTEQTVGPASFPIRRHAMADGAPRWRKLEYVLRVVREATKAIRAAGRPAIVVTYDPFVSGFAAVMIKLLTGARFICEINGAFGNLDNFADLPLPVRRRKRASMMRFGSAVLRRADGIRLLYDRQLDGFGVDVSRKVVRRYFDPVPIERFRDLGEDRVVLLVGYPFRRKGGDIAARAFAKIRDRFPDWKLVMIGFELGQNLEAMDLTLERIEAVPPMNNTRIAEWIGRAGIVVLPSRSEAMGRVLIEAAAAEKPRVGADVDGIHTVIEHGVDGFLFPKEDVDALAERLAELMSSPELRRRLGTAARTRVLTQFAPETYLERFREQADAVLSGR
jgi:glycosyltransferase involved in cell wall biosynthesis